MRGLEAKVDAFVLTMKKRDDFPTVGRTVDPADCSHAGSRHELSRVTEERIQRFIGPNNSRVSETLRVGLEIGDGAGLSAEDVLQLRTCSIAAYRVTSDAICSKLDFTARQLWRRRRVHTQRNQRERDKERTKENAIHALIEPGRRVRALRTHGCNERSSTDDDECKPILLR